VLYSLTAIVVGIQEAGGRTEMNNDSICDTTGDQAAERRCVLVIQLVGIIV